MADLALCLADSLAAQGGEDRTSGGPSLALPPVAQDGAEHGRHLEQLGPAGLHPRSPPARELTIANLEGLPGQLVEVVRAQAAEAAGDDGHRLPFEHCQLVVLLRVLVREVDEQLRVLQDGSLFDGHLREARHGGVVARVGLHGALALEHLEHDADGLAHVGDRLPRLALGFGEVESCVDMAGLDHVRRHVLEHGEGVGAQARQLVLGGRHGIGQALEVHALGGFAEGLGALGVSERRGFVGE